MVRSGHGDTSITGLKLLWFCNRIYADGLKTYGRLPSSGMPMCARSRFL